MADLDHKRELLIVMLEAFQNEIENNEWDKVLNDFYNEMETVTGKKYQDDLDRNDFVSFLLENDIDFLPYIDAIPSYSFYLARFPDKTVVVPANIKSIGASAFSTVNFDKLIFNCSANAFDISLCDLCTINELVLPKDMTELPTEFLSGSDIKHIEGLDRIEEFNEFCFDGAKLQTFTGGSHVKKICRFCFNACKLLYKVDLSATVESLHIGEYAFCGCESLTEVHLPKKIDSIGFNAFGDCSEGLIITVPMTYDEWLDQTGIADTQLLDISDIDVVWVFTDKKYKCI